MTCPKCKTKLQKIDIIPRGERVVDLQPVIGYAIARMRQAPRRVRAALAEETELLPITALG